MKKIFYFYYELRFIQGFIIIIIIIRIHFLNEQTFCSKTKSAYLEPY